MSTTLDMNTTFGQFINAIALIALAATFAATYLMLAEIGLAYRRNRTTHDRPLSCAVREVLLDRPLALHRRRLAVVHAADARRAAAYAAARDAAILRHPSAHHARRAAMAQHPSVTHARQSVVSNDGVA